MASNRIGRSMRRSSGAGRPASPFERSPRLSGRHGLHHPCGHHPGDLRYSKIYVSVLDKNQEKDVLKGLKSASGFLRRELGHALQLRYTPELQFIADNSIAYGAHILEVLRDPEKVKPANPDNDAVLPEEE